MSPPIRIPGMIITSALVANKLAPTQVGVSFSCRIVHYRAMSFGGFRGKIRLLHLYFLFSLGSPALADLAIPQTVPNSACELQVLGPKEMAASSVSILAQALASSAELRAQVIAQLPGGFITVDYQGQSYPLHYEIHPSANSQATVLFDLDGLGGGVRRLRTQSAHLNALKRDHHVVLLSLPGQDASLAMLNFGNRGRLPQLNNDDFREILGRATQSLRLQLQNAGLDDPQRGFAIAALSWAGWLALDFAADPNWNQGLTHLLLEDPGIRCLVRHHHPVSADLLLRVLEGQAAFSQNLCTPVFLNPARMVLNAHTERYRAMVRNFFAERFPNMAADDLRLEGAAMMVTGMQSVSGLDRALAIPAHIRVRLLIASEDLVMPPDLMLALADALFNRAGASALETTSVELLDEVPHLLTAVSDMRQQRAWQSRWRNFTPGWIRSSGGQIIDQNREAIRARILELPKPH